MIFIKKNIVMVGMTGVGKTTIGKVLSKKLKKKFFDIDFEIENASGLKIADLFSEYGEKEFRKIEKKIIVKILNDYSEAIISTGAGSAPALKIMAISFASFISSKPSI